MKKNRCHGKPQWNGLDDHADNAFEALYSWSPAMDESAVLKLLAEAEDDPNPKFEFVADPANPRRAVDAARAAMEVDRALQQSGTRSLEVGMRKGRVIGISVERDVEISPEKALDDVIQSSDFLTMKATRHGGRMTAVTVREHRRLK